MLLALLFASPCAARADEPARALPEANAFLQGLAARQREYEQAVNDYTYDVDALEEQLDGRGRVAKSVRRGYEVFHVRGVPVRKQVSADGRPLEPEAQRREARRVEKRAAGIRARRAREQQPGVRLSQVLERFDFKTVAREQRDGRDTLLIDFVPRPGKRDLEHDKELRILAGRLWVDEQTRNVVRMHLRNTGTLKYGLGLGATLSELELQMEFQKVDDVWLPKSSETFVAARVLLFKGLRQRERESYGRYRKFEVTSEERLEPAGE